MRARSSQFPYNLACDGRFWEGERMIFTVRRILCTGVPAGFAGAATILAAMAQSTPAQLGVAPAAEPPSAPPPLAAASEAPVPAAPGQPMQIQPGQSSQPGMFGTIGRWF